MATVTFKITDRAAKIKSERIAQFPALGSEATGTIGVISAIKDGICVKQFIFTSSESAYTADIDGVVNILGGFDAERGYGEAYLNGDVSALSEAQVKKIAEYVAKNDDKYEYKSLQGDQIITGVRTPFIQF